MSDFGQAPRRTQHEPGDGSGMATSPVATGAVTMRIMSGFLAKALGAALSRMHIGGLTLVLPDGRRVEGRGPVPGPAGMIHVHRLRCLGQLLFTGDVAFAEAYMRGDWTTPDLASVIEVVARNREALDQAIDGFGPARALDWVTHRLRANSKAGSRRNISAHYDLGNEFYAEWLDEAMVYSSAIFERSEATLEEAQAAKLDRVMDLVDAQPGHRVLEIGVGWGALASRIAQCVGAHVTGLTLSAHQLAHVQALAARDGLSDKIDARYEDYRDARGTFDRIVSVEMIEAVGRAYWPAYFSALRDRLRPGGHAIVQAITIDHARLEEYAAKPDFIQIHIFPGGMLPSIEAMADEAARAGLSFECVERFGASYARTLAEWRGRFLSAWPRIEAMGFDDVFRRKWEYYLGYCEGGFRAGAIDVGLYKFAPVR